MQTERIEKVTYNGSLNDNQKVFKNISDVNVSENLNNGDHLPSTASANFQDQISNEDPSEILILICEYITFFSQ